MSRLKELPSNISLVLCSREVSDSENIVQQNAEAEMDSQGTFIQTKAINISYSNSEYYVVSSGGVILGAYFQNVVCYLTVSSSDCLHQLNILYTIYKVGNVNEGN